MKPIPPFLVSFLIIRQPYIVRGLIQKIHLDIFKFEKIKATHSVFFPQ